MAEKKETKETKETKEVKETKKKAAPKKDEVKKTAPKKDETKKAAPKKDDAEKKANKASAAKKDDAKVKADEAKKTVSTETEKAEETKVEAAPNATLQKKRERREAKAARKAANLVEEKKSRPNNLLLGIMIFGVLIGMFAFVAGYNYFSKPATIEKYIEKNGGEEVYGSMQMDEYTTANITAKGNSMTIDMKADVEEEVISGLLKDAYSGDDGKEQLEDIAAYFLTTMKPGVRGFDADATVKMTLNGEELNTVKMTYKEAKKKAKEAQKEAEEEAEEEHNHEHEDADAEHDHEGEDAEQDHEGEEAEAGADTATETEAE